MLVVSTVTLKHRTNKIEESVLVCCFLCFSVELGKKALFQWETKGCLNKQVNAVTVAFVLQPFSYKQFQITLQYQPQCVLCLEKIPLIIKALHKKTIIAIRTCQTEETAVKIFLSVSLNILPLIYLSWVQFSSLKLQALSKRHSLYISIQLLTLPHCLQSNSRALLLTHPILTQTYILFSPHPQGTENL